MKNYLKSLMYGCGILFMSLLVVTGAFAGDNFVRKAKEKIPAQTGIHLKSRFAIANRSEGKSELFVRSEHSNVVASSLEKIKRGAPVKNENVLAGVIYETGNFKLGYGLLNPNTGTWTPKVEDGVCVHAIGYNEDLKEVYTLEYNVYSGNEIGEISSNVYDFTSGDKKSFRYIESQEEFDNFPLYAAYLPSENAFYGYGNAGWVKWDMNSLSGTLIKAYTPAEYAQNNVPSLCYDYNRDSFVGLANDNSSSQLYLIGKTDGHISPLGKVASGSYYVGGLGYDSESNQYLWNPNDDYSSQIIAIDADNFEISKLCTFPVSVEFGSLFIPEFEKPAGSDSPLAPEFIGGDFPNGGTTGTISFKLPVKLNNGSDITGKVKYNVSVGGIEIAAGEGNAGEVINIEVGESAKLSQGAATFKITAEVNGNISNSCRGTVWIGYDTPMAPTNVKLTPAQVTWDAVTTGIHGGYIDESDIYYSVSLNGEVIADYVTGTNSVSGLTLTSPLDTYIASVTATNHGLTSMPGKSNDITYGEPGGVPYYIAPTLEEFEKSVVFNLNNDKDWQGNDQTWRYDPYDNALVCNDDWQGQSDDWIFLPPVNIKETDYFYSFSMKAWCLGGEGTADNLEVYLCDTPDPYTYNKIAIMPNLKAEGYPYGGKPNTYSQLFSIGSPGNYYIGIHNVTANGWYAAYVKDINLDVTELDAMSASAVTDLKATPAEKGGLSATLTFKMPTSSIGGYGLQGDITATIVSEAETISITGAQGSEQSVVIKTVQSTEEEGNVITVTTSCQGKEGASASVKVYTGVVLAAAPTNIRMQYDENNMGGLLMWDAPDKALNVYDGYIGDKFEYTVCRLVPGYANIEEVWEPVMNVGSATEFRISIPDGSSQSVRSYGVIATNAAGCGGKMIMDNRYFQRDEPAMAGRNFVLGKLYELPAIEEITAENVSSNSLPYGPMTYDLIETGGGYIVTPRLLDNSQYPLDSYPSPSGGAMIVQWQPGRDSNRAAKAEIGLPKFSLKGKNKVSFTPNFYLPTVTNLEIGVLAYGSDKIEIIADFASVIGGDTEGWNEMQVNLPEKFANAPWVQIFLYPSYKGYDRSLFLMSGFKLMNNVPYDLAAVSIDAPDDVEQGSNFTITATARNYGVQEIRSYSATLFADGKVVAKTTGSNVKSLESTQVSFETMMDPIATKTVNYKVEFTCAGDSDSDNDMTKTVYVIPTESLLPRATELQAEFDESGVVLTWLEPGDMTIAGEPVTEDFEDAGSFSNQYGDWIFVDRDESVLGGIGNVEIPNVTPGETKGSFMIWDNDVLQGRGTESHSGTKSLFALYREDDGQSDDWAISPELCGMTQTVSFYAKSYDENYPHYLEVWYSEGSVNPDDFKQITLTGPSVTPSEWCKYKATLPEGAKRFAIRNVTDGGFILFIDDVTYVPAASPDIELDLKGYDVYRDGVKITSQPVTTTAYEDIDVTENNTYSYMVTVVYDKGISGPSNTVSIKVSGLDSLTTESGISAGRGYIRLTGFEGEEFLVSTPDGKVAASGIATPLTTINLDEGVYIVKAGKKIGKVLVK